MTDIRKIITAGLLLVSVTAVAEVEDGEKKEFSYRPNVHGTLRPRFELDTENGDARFAVRNARLSLDGKVAPEISYYLQMDLCDQGVFKPLDFYVRMDAAPGLKVQAGQFRIPFGVEPFRGPHTYIFANRSFIGKEICNYRAVGCKLTYTLPKIPLTLEAGAFNSSAITMHTVWSKKLAYAAKATYTLGEVKLSTGFMSIAPDEVRANLTGVSVAWASDRWTVEGEYMYEHYTGDAHCPSHGYCVFGSYRMPVRAGIFNYLSFQGRADGMTDHSDIHCNELGVLQTDDIKRNRLTAGVTLSYLRSKNVFVDLRLNYEKYFYPQGTEVASGCGDKAVVEIVLRF
ncbi:MAG: porin [Muribaculaceae bacterium]|nr:porin [Muribaculaceae bacterium]